MFDTKFLDELLDLTVCVLWQNPNQTAVMEKKEGAGQGASQLLLNIVLGEASF